MSIFFAMTPEIITWIYWFFFSKIYTETRRISLRTHLYITVSFYRAAWNAGAV